MRTSASGLATWDEVVQLVNVVGRESTGVFQIAPEVAERDTPAAAMAYARTFHPSFVGLAPPREELVALMRAFHLTAYETPPADSAAGGYMVTHGTHSVIVDADGRVRVLHPFGSTVQDVVEDVERVM